MKVKIFALSQEEQANDFIQSAVLLEEGSVQVTSDGNIIIFYRALKEDYENAFVQEMISNLKRNLFHERVRQASNDAEFSSLKEAGRSTYPEFDEAGKKQKEITQNIANFEAKIAALESWTANNTSNK